MGGGWWYSQQERHRAEREAGLRQTADHATAEAQAKAQESRERAVELAQQKADEQERAASLQYALEMNLAQRAWDNTNIAQVRDLLQAQVPKAGELDRRGWEWYYQQRLCQTERLTLTGHTDGVLSVAFSPDGRRLASASLDQTVRLWDAASGQELRALKGHTSPVWSVAFSPDGRRLASASNDQTVRLWDAASGQELRALKGHTSSVHSVAFSPDGRRLASAGYEQTVRLWDAASGQELRALKGHTSDVYSVAFSPDGRRLASAGYDQTVRLWDAASGQELRALKGHTSSVHSVAFSPDGRRLASASRDGTVRLWDAASGQELRALKGHTSEVWSVAFSPDGRRLASASPDGTVRLWDAASGQELRALKGDTRGVHSVAFSADGTCLACGCENGNIAIYDARPLTPQLRAEGEALVLLDDLGAAYHLQSEVLAAIPRTTGLPDDVRELALRWAQQRRDDPEHLNDASWAIVCTADAPPEHYRQALHAAEAACRLEPGESTYLTTLGVAQYRVGRYRDALTTLTQAEPLNAERYGGSIPADLAFRAMAHWQLRHKEEMATNLGRLRQVMKGSRWANDPKSRAFLQEAEALIEGKTPDGKMPYADP
jgi:WD40 repeat protein